MRWILLIVALSVLAVCEAYGEDEEEQRVYAKGWLFVEGEKDATPIKLSLKGSLTTNEASVTVGGCELGLCFPNDGHRVFHGKVETVNSKFVRFEGQPKFGNPNKIIMAFNPASKAVVNAKLKEMVFCKKYNTYCETLKLHGRVTAD